MAVHDTDENGKTEYTRQTLECIDSTVTMDNDVYVIDNGSCKATKDLLAGYTKWIQIITLPENIGTAKAINIAWQKRKPGQHCVKIDNDILIHQHDWIEQMEAAIAREPKIGQVGLKRKDCIESPYRTDQFKSELIQLPHQPGETWITVEKAGHIMGSCVMHSAALLDKIGYLYQPDLYGYDDVLMSHRANAAGFMTCFLSHIPIDHIDPGGTIYNDWKIEQATKYMPEISRLIRAYHEGKEKTYYGPNGEHD